MEKDKKYFANKDLTVLFVYLVLIAGIVCFSVFFNRNYAFVALLVFVCLFFVFYTCCVFRSYYVFKEDYLLVIHGFIKRRIHYKNIEKTVEKKCFAFPFISFKNLKILNGSGITNYEYVCPKDVEDFVDELEKKMEISQNLMNYMELEDE